MPYLGLCFADDNFTIYGIPNQMGISIKSVDLNSPAQMADIRKDDNLVFVNDTSISNIVEYNEAIRSLDISNYITLTVIRNGISINKEIQINERK